MTPRNDRAFAISLFLIALAVVAVNLGNPLGLHQNDEDHYVGIARDMLANGNWLLPTFMGKASFHKPPLLYWLMMASMSLFGPSLLAARLPVAAAAVATVLATGLFGRRLFGREAGWMAAAVTATSVGFFQYGRAAMMDLPLALLVLVAAWGFWEAREGRHSGLYAAGAAAGLATLLKGPVGIPLCLAGGVAWWIAASPPARLPVRHPCGALALAATLAAAWPLLLCLRGEGAQWFQAFIVGENLGKFTDHPVPLWSMLSGFGALQMPWTPLLAGAWWMWATRRGWRDSALLLPVAFVAANVAVYALPATKWPQYLLPSLPLAALLLGWAAAQPARLPVRLGGWAAAVVLAVAVPLLAVAPRLFPDGRVRFELLLVAGALMAAAWFLTRGPELAGAAVAMACALAGVALLAPAVTLNVIPPEFAEITRGHEVVTYGVPPYPYANTLGRAVGVHDHPEDFRADFARDALIVVGDSELSQLMRAHALDLDHSEMLLCWRKWRRSLNLPLMLRGLREGSLGPLTENVCVLRRRPAGRSSAP